MSKQWKPKSSLGDKVFVVCNTIFLVSFVIITLYPVLNTVALSFNNGIDAVRGGIHLLPRVFTLQNYKTVLGQQNIITGAYISVARTVVGTILSLAANALLAYVVSRKRFLFRSQLSLFWVITMYVSGGMIPTLILYRNLGLTGTFWVYVIPGMISVFNMLVLRTYMMGLPEGLEESAQIDGANDFTIFVRIVSPGCFDFYIFFQGNHRGAGHRAYPFLQLCLWGKQSPAGFHWLSAFKSPATERIPFLSGSHIRLPPDPAFSRIAGAGCGERTGGFAQKRYRANGNVQPPFCCQPWGLGWIGKSCHLINPKVGPRLRLPCVLTNRHAFLFWRIWPPYLDSIHVPNAWQPVPGEAKHDCL